MTRNAEISIFVISVACFGAMVARPRLASGRGQARKAAAQSEISTFGTALDLYKADTGSYPRGRNGLRDLAERPLGVENWQGPYVRGGIPLDPWSNAYRYEYPGKHNRGGYDLSSWGADGKAGGGDDIANWRLAGTTP